MGYRYPPVDADNYVSAIDVIRGMGLPSHRLDILLGKYGKLRNFIYKTNRGQRVIKTSERSAFEKVLQSFI
jgi:hypothetical protein